MADVKCGRFKIRTWKDPKTRLGTWAADIEAAPDTVWWKVFEAELATEAAIGNVSGSGLRLEGNSLVFDAHEIMAEAAASVVRRAADKTDRKVADLRTQEKKRTEALKQDYEKAGQELRDLQQKYKDGI